VLVLMSIAVGLVGFGLQQGLSTASERRAVGDMVEALRATRVRAIVTGQHHFPSKISLLMGVLERRDEVNGRIAAEVRTDNTLTGLLGGLRAINRSNATAPGVVRAFSILNAESLLENQPAYEWFQTRYERIHAHLLGQFSALVERGEVRADVDLDKIIRQLLAMMDGLQIQWLRFPDQVDLVECFDTYIAQVDAAVRARP